jgi:hypothetical protein
MSVIIAILETEIKKFEASQGQKSKILSQKYPIPEKAGGAAQVIEHFLSKYEALSPNPVPQKKKKRKERIAGRK